MIVYPVNVFVLSFLFRTFLLASGIVVMASSGEGARARNVPKSSSRGIRDASLRHSHSLRMTKALCRKRNSLREYRGASKQCQIPQWRYSAHPILSTMA
jgi:hypothetical protein